MKLLVIEAPGKLHSFQRALGRGFRVFATRGHFVQSPKSLFPLGIDRSFRETLRTPDLRRADALIAAANGMEAVYLATDADDEGEVIAADVASLLPKLPPYRVVVRDLSRDSVARALRGAHPYEGPGPGAVAGRARATLDRLIGGVFSGEGFSVGRVLTPLLAAAGQDAERMNSPASGHGTGTALLRLQRELGLPVTKGMDVLQTLYERGLMSYPRTSSGAYSADTRIHAERFARSVNLPPLRELPALEDQACTGQYPHEGLHPTAVALRQLSLSGNPIRMTIEAGALTVLGRMLLEDLRDGKVPWEVSSALNARGLQTDGRVLALMIRHGLGRPSTWADHATRAVERNLVRDCSAGLTLSLKGQAWLSRAPEFLRSVAFSRQTEDLIRDGAMQGLSAPAIVAKAVSLWPAEAVVRADALLEEVGESAADAVLRP